jgi:DNA-binding NarL/FixJ family response regulator
MTIRVLLADDHAVVRDGLRLLLEAEDDIVVAGSAADGRQAVDLAHALRPDVAVVDIAMPEANGIDATREIRETCPETRVLILSMHSGTEEVRLALRAGACGYVLKKSAGAEVVAAVRALHAGEGYLSAGIAGTVIEDYAHHTSPGTPLDALTTRERQVLQLVAEGNSSEQVARALFLSRKTVDTYRSRLMDKLGIHDLHGLVRFAVRHGLATLD